MSTSFPIEAFASYAYTYGRTAWLERLSELLLADEVPPGDVRDALAQPPFDPATTTNVDFLVEDAHTKQCRPHPAVLGESQSAIRCCVNGREE